MLLSKIVDAVNAKSFGETNWTYDDIYPYFAQAISEINGELEDFRRIDAAPQVSESSPYYSIAAYNALPDTHILNYVVTYITVAMDNAQLAVTSRTQSYATQLAKYKQQLIADLYKWMPLRDNSNVYFDLEHDGRDTRRLPVVGKCWYNEDEGGKLSCNPSSDGNYQTNPSLGVHCENPYGYLVPRDTTQKILKGTYYYDYIFVPYEAFRPYYDPVGVRVAITGYDIPYTSIPYTTIEHLDVKHITNSSGDTISIDDNINMNNKQISNTVLDNVFFSDNDCSLNLDSMHINIGNNILIDKYADEDSINLQATADGATATSFYMAPNSPVTLSYGNYELLVHDGLEYKPSYNQTLFEVSANRAIINRGSTGNIPVLGSNNNETYLLGYNNNNLYGVVSMTNDETNIVGKSVVLQTLTNPPSRVELTSNSFTYNHEEIATQVYTQWYVQSYTDNAVYGNSVTLSGTSGTLTSEQLDILTSGNYKNPVIKLVEDIAGVGVFTFTFHLRDKSTQDNTICYELTVVDTYNHKLTSKLIVINYQTGAWALQTGTDSYVNETSFNNATTNLQSQVSANATNITTLTTDVASIKNVLNTEISDFDTLAEIATYLQEHTSEYTDLVANVQTNANDITNLKSAETGIQANEALRVTAESARANAETTRQSNESGRVQAENARVLAEETRSAFYEGFNTALSGKEDKTNKVTSLSSSSTDTQYPSAKVVYDGLNAITLSGDNTSVEINSKVISVKDSYVENFFATSEEIDNMLSEVFN